MENLLSSTRAKQSIALATFTENENIQIATLCAAVSAMVRKFTRRDLTLESYTELADGTGTTFLLLKQYPISNVTQVCLVGNEPNHDVGGYTLDASHGILIRSNSIWNKGYSNYSVVYEGGYETLPEDLVEACAEWVAALFWQTKDNPAYGAKLPTNSMRRILRQYQRTLI